MKALARLHGDIVGELHLTGDLTTFRFAREWLRMPDRPVLGRWFEDRLSDELVVKGIHSQLPSFFQNYLPEAGSALRDLLARRGGVPANRELALLVALGPDLPGALVVEAVSNGDTGGDAEMPARDGVDDPPSGPLRFSLAGMQLKLSVLEHESSFTLPVTGVGGRWILKFADVTHPVIAENEFAMMIWARRSGINVPDVRLVTLKDVVNLPEGLADPMSRGLLVERFDRPRDGGPRIHQEDFAQLLDVRSSAKYGREAGVTYDRVAKLVATICGVEDLEELIRRLVFNLLCGNPDAHLKNWSLWYPERRRPRLSPAYDLVSTVLYPVKNELACRLADEWDPREIRSWHFGKLASRAGIESQRGVAIAEEAAAKIRAAWAELPNHATLPPSLEEALSEHLSRSKL